jgi:hypothetical protein
MIAPSARRLLVYRGHGYPWCPGPSCVRSGEYTEGGGQPEIKCPCVSLKGTLLVKIIHTYIYIVVNYEYYAQGLVKRAWAFLGHDVNNFKLCVVMFLGCFRCGLLRALALSPACGGPSSSLEGSSLGRSGASRWLVCCPEVRGNVQEFIRTLLIIK